MFVMHRNASCLIRCMKLVHLSRQARKANIVTLLSSAAKAVSKQSAPFDAAGTLSEVARRVIGIPKQARVYRLQCACLVPARSASSSSRQIGHVPHSPARCRCINLNNYCCKHDCADNYERPHRRRSRNARTSVRNSILIAGLSSPSCWNYLSSCLIFFH